MFELLQGQPGAPGLRGYPGSIGPMVRFTSQLSYIPEIC